MSTKKGLVEEICYMHTMEYQAAKRGGKKKLRGSSVSTDIE